MQQIYYPPPQLHKHRGFTLIELSIVLVIIGLVVGGVLVGRDLIKAAEIRAQISQIEKYNTAVHTFKLKYNGIPGDLSYTVAGSYGFVNDHCDGAIGARDGNGILESYPPPYDLDQFFGGPALFWEDLSYSGLIKETFPANGGAIQTCWYVVNSVLTLDSGLLYVGNFIPTAAINGGNFIHVYAINGINYFGLSGVTGTQPPNQWVMQSTRKLAVITAYNIDTKIDDGFPLTGIVTTKYLSNSRTIISSPNSATDSTTTCSNNSIVQGAYSIGINGGSGLNCSLSFKFQ